MRVLVTGAGGFIGRRVVHAAAARGWSVTAVVRAGAAEVAGAARTVAADLSAPGWAAALPVNVDAIVHLAQSRRYREFPAGAEDVRRVNVDATHELVDWAARVGVRTFVHASTGNVYRDGPALLTEDDATGPADFYGASKLAGELMVRPYADRLAVRIARLFSVYGPGQAGMTVPNLIARIQSGQPLTLAGGAGLVLSPLFVDDCADALLRIADGAPAPGLEIFNLAGDDVVDLRVLGGMLGEALGIDATFQDAPGAPRHLAGDASRVRAATGWRPAVALRDGCARTVAALALPLASAP